MGLFFVVGEIHARRICMSAQHIFFRGNSLMDWAVSMLSKLLFLLDKKLFFSSGLHQDQ